MIETLKDLKHGKRDQYDQLAAEKMALQTGHNHHHHHAVVNDSEDSLESTRARVLGEAPFSLPHLPFHAFHPL
jgi:hypothetical protein